MAIPGSRSSLPGGWAVIAAAAATLAAAACIPGSIRTVPPARPGPVRVTGTLVVIAPAGPRSREATEIELPDASVYLVDARGNRTAEARTQLDGRFEVRAPAPGRYRFCYEIGAMRDCRVQIRAAGETIWLGPVAAAVQSVHGQALTGDGRPCWVSDSFFGLNVSTQVSARRADASGPPAASARANSDGEYALIGLPDGTYEVAASCEAARAVRTIRVEAGRGRADFGLPNHAPVIRTAAAYAGTAGRTSAITGETLAVRADVVDPEGDSIQYIWRGLPGAGLVAGGGANVQWQLPATPGLVSAYLIARDGRGGYAYRRVDMEVAARRTINVSGLAIDETTGRAISNAVVTLGRESTRTDAAGRFSIQAAPRDDGRYVVNIRHPDYALMSRIIDDSSRGAAFEMTAAQVSQVAPGQSMRIVDSGSAGFCGAPGNARARPVVRRSRPEVVGPAGEDDRGADAYMRLAQASREDQPCVRRGAEITIPAGALETADHRPVTGPVRAAVTTLNPARRSLPGDYSAITSRGEIVSLLSFGAVDAQLTDLAGRPLNLRPGTSAEVRIPVPPSQAGRARPTMAMWSYDAERGRWIEEGQAVLEQTRAGPVYVGRTSHFSTINIDLPGWTAANVTCLRVQLDPLTLGPWSDKVLRTYVSYGGTSVQIQDKPLDNAPMHAIFTIPWGTTQPHNTVRLELRGTLGNTVYVLLDQIIDTDALPQRTPPGGPFPPAPYDDCGPPFTLTAPPTLIPYYGTYDATGRPAFLAGPGGAFNPANPDTANYYAHLDQLSGPTPNLGAWWGAHGFDSLNGGANGNATYAATAYMNYNDLGFGRDMHCLVPAAGRLACYVTNYGLPDQSQQNADDAANHVLARRGATVVMDYDSTRGAYAVRFAVYGGGDAAAPRVNFADLDGLGPKPVPYLCTVCHGGLYDANANVQDVGHARFREFDLPSFRYASSGAGPTSWDYGQAVPPTLDAPAFARLNEMVQDAHPGTAIDRLIAEWYPSFVGGPLPGVPAPPASWPNAAYQDIFGQSCRTCHIARDYGTGTSFYVFDNFTQFQILSVKNRVCGTVIGSGPARSRVMPNAWVTYRNFWAHPTRAQDFEALYLNNTNDCGS